MASCAGRWRNPLPAHAPPCASAPRFFFLWFPPFATPLTQPTPPPPGQANNGKICRNCCSSATDTPSCGTDDGTGPWCGEVANLPEFSCASRVGRVGPGACGRLWLFVGPAKGKAGGGRGGGAAAADVGPECGLLSCAWAEAGSALCDALAEGAEAACQSHNPVQACQARDRRGDALPCQEEDQVPACAVLCQPGHVPQGVCACHDSPAASPACANPSPLNPSPAGPLHLAALHGRPSGPQHQRRRRPDCGASEDRHLQSGLQGTSTDVREHLLGLASRRAAPLWAPRHRGARVFGDRLFEKCGARGWEDGRLGASLTDYFTQPVL